MSLFPGSVLPWRDIEATKRIEGALTALNDLGTPERIADHLGTLGVKGKIGRACQCPVARYVNLVAATPSGREFAVNSGGWSLYDFNAQVQAGVGSVPPNLQRFILNFDCGEYPGLAE